MLDSISHIALVVNDAVRTAALFHELFGARVVERKDAEAHLETFVKLGGTWIVLVAAPVKRARTGDHIAFPTSQILEALSQGASDGQEFIGARSDRALYFFDYDDHVFELDTEDIDRSLET
jgi:catechol 2,3-dioxygenase-like lactoylglutathione lyase family enzyme